jgi:small-conductance mechanosensitive channel
MPNLKFHIFCTRQLWCALRLVAMIAAVNFTGAAYGQAPATTAAPAETPVPQAVPLAEIASTAQADLAKIAALESSLASRKDIDEIDKSSRQLIPELDARLNDSTKILAARASVDVLRSLQRNLQQLRTALAVDQHRLSDRLGQLEGDSNMLDELEAKWRATQEATRAGAPSATVQLIGEVLQKATRLRAQMERARAHALTVQDRVAAQEAKVQATLDELAQSRVAAMSRLLSRDSPPLWRMEMVARPVGDLINEGRDALKAQGADAAAYMTRRSDAVLLHVLVYALLVGVFWWMRGRMRTWVTKEPELESTVKVFDVPLATALLLSLMTSGWIYAEAPRLLWALLGAVALAPATIILRHAIVRALFPILNALVVFYFVDQLRAVTAPLPWASRSLLLLETLAGAMLSLWILKRHVRWSEQPFSHSKFWRVIHAGAYAALVGFALSIIANLFGFAELANLSASIILASAYTALFAYTLLRILDGLILAALRLYPLARFTVVQRHWLLIRIRTLRILQIAAWVLWSFGLLERLSIWPRVSAAFKTLLAAQLDWGSLHISLGDVLACIITVYAAVLVSRFVRFLLDEEIYPRVALPRGVPYAISRLLHYTILVVGFITAVAAAGVDLTRFTILASAFGLGIGFGLQNIINNFVSGIILLFERPVQVGDAVQIADVAGVIARVGIRASIIRLPNGAEVIVPNSSFITERVTNRTVSNPDRTITIKVAVAYGSNAADVTRTLTQVALEHDKIEKTPPPQAVFIDFTDRAVTFELRTTTDQPQDLVATRTELGIAIEKLFMEGTLRAPDEEHR